MKNNQQRSSFQTWTLGEVGNRYFINSVAPAPSICYI